MEEKNRLQVNKAHYFKNSYDTKERFLSYWHQISALQAVQPASILEIGIGSGLVSQYLKQRSVEIITLDIHKELHPDIVGNAAALPFHDEYFGAVACFELLEHLPYEKSLETLIEIHRVTRRFSVLSIPDCSRNCQLFMKFPILGTFRFLIPLLSRVKVSRHDFDGQHFWEIGKASFPLNKIKRDIQSCGFKINRTYRVFEAPWYRFFILEKK